MSNVIDLAAKRKRRDREPFPLWCSCGYEGLHEDPQDECPGCGKWIKFPTGTDFMDEWLMLGIEG